MANDLLGDSSLDEKPSLDKETPPIAMANRLVDPKGASSSATEPYGSRKAGYLAPITISQAIGGGQTYTQTNPALASSPLKKPSPPKPRSSRRRKGSARARRTSPRGNSGVGASNPTFRSRAGSLDPLGMNPPKLVTSTPASLGSRRGRRGGGIPASKTSAGTELASILQNSDPVTTAAAARKVDPRPVPRLQQSSTTSRVSRLMRQKSVFKRMTSAFVDRFHTKSQTSAKGLAPIDRYPLAEIFADKEAVNIREAPTEFGNRLQEDHACEADTNVSPSPLVEDPFKTENILDSSLDSILPFPPLAASTPPARHRRAFRALSQPDANAEVAPPPSIIRAGFGVAPSESLPNLTLVNAGCAALREMDHNIVGDYRRGRHRVSKFDFGHIPVLGDEDRKKHPSPNKKDLELLEMRFRKQFPNIVHRATGDDETDELAKSFLTNDVKPISSSNALLLGATNAKRLGVSARRVPLSYYPSSSSLSRPGPLPKPGVTQQASPSMHNHQAVVPMETDELQWDMEAGGLYIGGTG